MRGGVQAHKCTPVDKVRRCAFLAYMLQFSHMDVKEAGRLGAAITNKKLTTEGRKKAAAKGWKLRKKRLSQEKNHADN